MQIGNWDMRIRDNSQEVSAEIDGFRLWYRLPLGYHVSRVGDPFLAAAFFPAMATGEDIELEQGLTVSSMLEENLKRLQDVFSCWNPLLRHFNICGERGVSESCNDGVASYFSGGVDSLHTVHSNQKEITHLIYINGFDFEISPEVFQRSIAHNHHYAKHYGNMSLVPVETNYFSFIKEYRVGRALNHGSCLASIGHLLGFRKILIPASYTYAQGVPWGSTPLTDPMWSTEATAFVHHGAEAKRTEKTIVLSEDKAIVDNLVVCWRQPDYNCCECSKCLRTMLTLHILGKDARAFARRFQMSDFKKIKISDHHDIHFVQENYELAEERGRREIAATLDKIIRRYEIRQTFYRIEKHLLRGQMKKLYRRLRNREDQRVWLTPVGKDFAA